MTANQFVDFVQDYLPDVSYDSILSYYNGRREISFEVLQAVCQNLKIDYQDVLLPNSLCKYNDAKNDINLLYLAKSNFIFEVVGFGCALDNIKQEYTENTNKEMELSYLSSEAFEKEYLDKYYFLEKILQKIYYLLQKYLYSYVNRHELDELEESFYYIFGQNLDELLDQNEIDTFRHRVPQEEFYYYLSITKRLSFIPINYEGFEQLLKYISPLICQVFVQFLTPCEKDILLYILVKNDFKGYDTVKSALRESNARINSVYNAINIDCEEKDITNQMSRALGAIANVDFKTY